MKLRLPTRLVQALLTTCASVLSTTLVYADIPAGYTPVTITDVDQLADYTESDYIAFIISTDITNTAYRMTGEHQYWTDSILHTHTMSFSGNESELDDVALYIKAELVAELFQELSFSQNAFSSGAGAIRVDGALNLTGNENVTFSGNTWNTWNTIDMASSAIRVDGALILTGNENVTFSENITMNDWSGVSVISAGRDAVVTMADNGSVEFSGNIGVAIDASECDVNLEGNGTVTFSGNINPYDLSAILVAEGRLSLEGNGTVTFSGNCSAYGPGAIFAPVSITSITKNEVVEFSGNCGGYGGGAIGGTNGLVIEGNGSVMFSGNYTWGGSGGAIVWYGGLVIEGNGSVMFRGNYTRSVSGSPTTYRLRSVFMEGGPLNLAAGEGQDITFYDTLYAQSDGVYCPVSYNARYRDGDGVMREATGDIVFSGLHAAEDLAALKSDYTAQELTNSLTSEVYATTNLYGGRLRIEDGAIYKGNGINVAADSAATLRLAGGTLDQAGYNVTLNAGTTLDLAGANSITASSLELMDGANLTFNVGTTEGTILSLDALLMTGDITVTVSGDLTKEQTLMRFADASQYDFSRWSSEHVTVSGTDYGHLVWRDGVLSYMPWESSDIDVDTEVDDFGGEECVDISGNGHTLTVKHPVDLVHLAMKNGTVRLEGEGNNNVVRIMLTENGTLELAAGAGLNVGNIVSMVANGSADLVISGDIEINDIKAYGKPGNKGTLSYVNMTTADDYTIENMTISGSLIDVGEGTTLYLVNVDIKSDTHITDDPASVFVQGTHAELDGSNTWVDKRITTAEDTKLYLCGDTAKSITLAAGTDIVELTSDMFDTVTLTGTDLWLDMTGIAEATYGKDYFTLDFQDFAREMAKAQVDVETLHVYATLDGERYTEAYSTANGGLTATLYFQVPEPATSTLSLLALAALAARRRRK